MRCYICGEKEGFALLGPLVGRSPAMHEPCRRSLATGEPDPTAAIAAVADRGFMERSAVLREMFSEARMSAYPKFSVLDGAGLDCPVIIDEVQEYTPEMFEVAQKEIEDAMARASREIRYPWFEAWSFRVTTGGEIETSKGPPIPDADE